MKATTIVNLGTISGVKEFVAYSNEFDGTVDLASGKYIVDGKSIMGIFSLDLSKPIELTAEGSDVSVEKFMANIKHMVAE